MKKLLDSNVMTMMNDKTKQLEVLNYIVVKGVVQPKVTNSPLDKVADDEVHVSHFGATDIDAVIKEIVAFSGFNQAEGTA